MSEWHPVLLKGRARLGDLLWEVQLPSGRLIYCSLDEFEQCFMRLDVDDPGYYDEELVPFCALCGAAYEIVRPGKYQPVCNCKEG